MFQKYRKLLLLPDFLYQCVTVQGGLTSDLSLAVSGRGMA